MSEITLQNFTGCDEDEHFFLGKYDDEDFIYYLPASVEKHMLEHATELTMLYGEIYKKMQKMQMKEPR